MKHCGLYSKTLLNTTLTSSKYTHVYDAWISNSLIIHAVKKPITDDHLGQVDESWYITWTSKCNHLSKATTHIEHHNFLSQITLDRASCKQPSLVRDCNWPLRKIPQHTIMLFVCHPKSLHKHCFQFHWGHFNSQKKPKTMLIQNFGVTKKSIMVCYGIFWSGQLFLRCLLNCFSITFLPISHHLI